MRDWLMVILLCSGCAHAEPFVTEYYNGVFRGDLSWAEQVHPETEEGAALHRKFIATFVTSNGQQKLAEIDDPLVRAIALRHQLYWKQALLRPDTRELAERDLLWDVRLLLLSHGVTVDHSDEPTALQATLVTRGFEYRGGRTAPLLDFMLWRNTRKSEFQVELTDRIQPVTVFFLQNFLVRGWSHFATFGRSSTGGWADQDVLYCVEDAYDLESESFENGYLRHEARHFADYRLYPGLKQADLEYRAKLTELAFSADPATLLHEFAAHAANSGESAHSLANMHVVIDVARSFNVAMAPNEVSIPTSIESGEVPRVARELLKLHDDTLGQLGSQTEGSIREIQ